MYFLWFRMGHVFSVENEHPQIYETQYPLNIGREYYTGNIRGYPINIKGCFNAN